VLLRLRRQQSVLRCFCLLLLWFLGRWLATRFGLGIMMETTLLFTQVMLGSRQVFLGPRHTDRLRITMPLGMQVVIAVIMEKAVHQSRTPETGTRFIPAALFGCRLAGTLTQLRF
jgi:hypothetical protein